MSTNKGSLVALLASVLFVSVYRDKLKQAFGVTFEQAIEALDKAPAAAN
jgi:hypothetical protein